MFIELEIPINQEQLDKFGKEDPVAQLTWLLERDRELKKLWKCSCGKQLPTKGTIWKDRWDSFRRAYRLAEPRHNWYYCDACAEAREMGGDY